MSRPGGKKRKATNTSDASSQEHTDAGPQYVTQALKNVTRTGATFACGARDDFPLPGIAFKGKGEEEELLLPLRRDDVLKIKARAKVAAKQQHVDNAITPVVTAWEVDSDALELRNPKWRAFLHALLESVRKPLGISPTAVLEISLDKMVLGEPGARLSTRGDKKARQAGQFATLLVVLPGAFTGGEFSIQEPKVRKQDHDDGESKDDESQIKETKVLWRPADRDTVYDLSYAAFYDHCSYNSNPVASGTALCLVYDLATSTPSNVPLFAGPTVVQGAVEASLAQYLDVAPASLAKRYKISPDVWRTINEFGAERHFVYLVQGVTFEKLDRNETKIAQSLEAFCARSQGQYVLYLAGVLISKELPSFPCIEDADVNQVKATLKAPWIQSGETTSSSYPPIFLRHADDVASHDRLEVEICLNIQCEMNETDASIVEERHRNPKMMVMCTSHALVVQPTMIQLAQIARQPIADVISILRGLLVRSPAEAVQYARRFLSYRSMWRLCSTGMEQFSQFVRTVVEINDSQLFFDVLGTLDFESTENEGALYEAVLHFGWDVCIDKLVKCIMAMTKLRSRVNFVVSMADNGMAHERIGRFLDALLSLHPWTTVMVGPSHINSNEDKPSIVRFQSLLFVAHAASQEKLLEVVAVTDIEIMVELVVPALTDHVTRYPRLRWLRSALLHVWELYKPMLTRLYDEVYGVPFHCSVCDAVQSFIESTKTETTVLCEGPAHRQHIDDTLQHTTAASGASFNVEAVEEGAVRVIKISAGRSHPTYHPSQLLRTARQREKEIRGLLDQRT